MIDLIKAQNTFKEYIKNYNPEDEKVKIKISHIERVSQVAKNIAEDLNLDEENTKLAELIGLLHDIGRFEQIKQYHTFIDKISINHGEYGAKVLFENGLIRKFIKDDKYDNVIKKAIINHNKGKIEEGLTEKELLHAKIIRDADKTDIFYVLTFGDKEAIWESADLSNDIIDDEIYREFMEDREIKYQNRISSADILVSHFAYVFDFNFKEGLKRIYEKGYIEKLYNRFHFNDSKTQEKYEQIYKTTVEFTKKSLKA